MKTRLPSPSEKKRALRVMQALQQHMPDAHIELKYSTPLELLVAVILSAQCTDARVNMVTPKLFHDFPSAEAYAHASAMELEPYLKSLGLFRNKAKNLVAMGKALMEKHGGNIPPKREQLEEIPGVGKKTAGVVSMHLGSDVAFPVDTHVSRLSLRLGFTKNKTPDKIEADLQLLFPKDLWFLGHQLLVWHGRRTCFARSPNCPTCVVKEDCPKKGL